MNMNLTNDLLGELNVRLEKYAVVLKAAEDENNASKIRRYKRIIGQYNIAIKQAKSGKPVALSELPNPPGMPPLCVTESEETQDDPIANDTSVIPIIVAEEVTEFDIVGELSARLTKYSEVLKQSEDEGNASKSRRYKRIIEQYNDALSKVKAGKDTDLSNLPNPPGFAPLVPEKTPVPSPMPSPMPSPLPSRARTPTASPTASPSGSNIEQSPVTPQNLTRAGKQTALLKQRQKEYREAAVNAKRAGQIPEAKEYLKICKGFDPLIQASEGGLPVDLTTVPASPKSISDMDSDSFLVVSEKDYADNSDSEVFKMLKNELTDQMKACMTRRNQFKATGDIANANRFENFALQFKKDLNNVTLFENSNQPVPKFHFEQKTFSVVQCFSDIAAGNLELTIVQAVNLSKVCDTYVGYEFPYPSDAPPSGYSSVVKNSASPAYNTTVLFSMDRDSKPCQRIFKRHGIKLEIWAKGGLFHRDSSLGTVVVKLLPLASNIMIHDAFDIMNGRRPTGGKLEVKVRVRDPLITKKIDSITEKWLILD